MHQKKKLENEPYMLEIKKTIKPVYYAEIEAAVQNEDEDLIQTLLNKYLRKKQALQIFPKILFALRSQKRGKPKLMEQKGWPKPRILAYLRQKLQLYEYEYVWKCIEDGNYDLCNTLINDLLRYQEAEQIMPHIQKLIKKNLQNQDSVLNKMNETISQNKKDKQKIQNLNQSQIRIQLPYESKIQKKQKSQMLNKYDKKQLNPQKQSYLITSAIQPHDLTKSSTYIKQKAKRQLLLEIQTQMQNTQLYDEFQKYLQKGKIRKAEEIIKSVLGKKLADKYMTKLKQFFVQKINSPLQNSIFLNKTEDGISFYQIQTQQILEIAEDDIINILIVGMTGVGKSTYLNALVNYLLDVDIQDLFRYIVTRDMFKNFNGKSSTNKVNIYGIPKKGKMKKTVRLIDIPGLGDTGGIQKDKQHLKMIRQRIEKTVPFINQIIYVFKASDTRITKQTQYVIGQIMGMFAKDVQQNIIFVLTFADNDQPRVLGPLKSSFGTIIEQISKKNKDWYVKVNNSALFKKIDLSNHVDVCFYTMGQKCLQKITNIMFNSTKVSTKNTVSVMTYRQQLQQSIKALDQIIRASLQKQQNIKKTIKDLAQSHQRKDKINYKYKIKQQKVVEIPTDRNVTSCLNCKFPCHKTCVFGSNQQKQRCVAMQKGFCKICPNKCSWTAHINSHVIITREFVQQQKTDQQLFKMYNIQSSNIENKQPLLLDLITDYIEIVVTIKSYCQQLKIKSQQLSLLQLRKINHATVIQYIQILIDSSNNQRKQGYMEKIKEYEQLKRQQQRFQSILTQNQNKEINKFQDMIKNRIQSLIPNKQLAGKLIKTVLDNYQKIKIAKRDIKMIKDQEMKSLVPPIQEQVQQPKPVVEGPKNVPIVQQQKNKNNQKQNKDKKT